MKWVIGISFGELMLKGKNRMRFVNQSIKQIRKACEGYSLGKHKIDQGKLFIEAPFEDLDAIIDRIKLVFGLQYVYKAIVTEKSYEAIEAGLKELLKGDEEKRTFKAKATRADKSFPDNSMAIAAKVGGIVLKNFANYKVDVHHPERLIYVDIRERAYLYYDRQQAVGGLPLGTGGKALLLLSGGIDSPVAGYEIARRGVELSAVHFHSYPFTSQRAKDKVSRLAKQLAVYMGEFKLYHVNLAEIYTSINKHCRARFTTILARRFMMRIAEVLAEEYDLEAFVTGEALGQVASQTIQSISVVNEAAKRPILRPLISMDKIDIIAIAKKIQTYDISIEPYEDACSFFAPDRPVTKPRLYDIEAEEEKLNIDELVQAAIESIEVEYINFGDSYD